MPLKSQSVDVAGLNVFYLEGGSELAHHGTRVFMHGWGLTCTAFTSMLEALSQKYHVIALDLPGYGFSGANPSFWGYEAHAQFVDGFLRALSLESVHLMGQSMGAGICMATAALFPERVDSLVLVNAAGIPILQGQPRLSARIAEVFEQAKMSGFRRENAALSKGFIYNLWHHLPGLIRSVNLPIKHDLRLLLGRIRAPCLLAWGSLDTMLPLKVGREFERLIPGAQLVDIAEGYHEWNLIYPERFIEVVTRFYRGRAL
jgi:pimeloyl-ACP methyl ester carboxylesterase